MYPEAGRANEVLLPRPAREVDGTGKPDTNAFPQRHPALARIPDPP
jgi:hypothetical protein